MRHLESALKSFQKSLAGVTILADAKELHSYVAKSSHWLDLQPQLMEMYIRCGSLQDARAILDADSALPSNALLSAYLEKGLIDEARSIFSRVQDLDARQWTSVIAANARYGHFDTARDLLRKMPKHSVLSWTALLSGYVHHGRVAEARELFAEMPGRDLVAWNTVVSIFAEKGYLLEGREVFDKMPDWDNYSWKTMINAYTEHGYVSDATDLSNKMKKDDDAVVHCVPGHVEEAMKIVAGLV